MKVRRNKKQAKAESSKQGAPSKARQATGPAHKESDSPSLIVAVGGGTGSEHAFSQMLARLRSDSGMAFLFVSTAAKNRVKDHLANASILSVTEVQEKTVLKRDCIYVPPENHTLLLMEGGKAVMPASVSRNGAQILHLDRLFRSVATEAHERGVGVLLSGNGSDGVLGLTELKGEGGIIFVQDEGSATQSDLISKALSSGLVDFTFPPRRIGEELVRVADQLEILRAAPDDDLPGDERNQTGYAKIYNLLRALTAVDFSYYKPTTLKRRIQRRMVLSKISNVSEYVRFLQQNPAEVDKLFQDILINVTSFFRDPAVFLALKKRIFPKLTRPKTRDSAIRIWVPGCSTGEEVYSIAIALIEFLGTARNPNSIQIFATDISEAALAKARAGIYPESIAESVSAGRLRRFFQKTEGGYQISKYVRDFCVFARQNLFEDPPFSKLDLISCRNVLIYLGPQLQKKIIPIFHYALQPTGYLLLGGSETIGVFSNLFTVVDKRNKIYQKAPVAIRPEVEFIARPNVEEARLTRAANRAHQTVQAAGVPDLRKQVDRLLLSQYAPAGVVTNVSLDVLQFRGQTGLYLEHAAGEASLNLLKLVRDGLAIDLRTMVSRALKLDVVVRKDRVAFSDGKAERTVNIDVIPFRNSPSSERYLLIVFSDSTDSTANGGVSGDGNGNGTGKGGRTGVDREALRLREELSTTKESLQAIIEEQEATNEELKSANEEIQSSNEELQSTNEELETAKEELQSTNEELTTLNEELQSRNSELSQVNNDLSNLLSSVNLPIVMVGNDLAVRRFTPMAERHFNLIATDVGRRISDINPNIVINGMDQRVSEVIDTLKTQEHEVQDRGGRWYSLRIRPYRTSENKIDGAVLILVDIDEIKRGLEEVTELVKQPLLTLSGDFRVHRANRAFHEAFRTSPGQIEGTQIYDVSQGSWNIPGLRVLLEGILPEKRRVEDFRIEHDFPKIGRKTLQVSARVLQQESKGKQLVLLAFEDVTRDG